MLRGLRRKKVEQEPAKTVDADTKPVVEDEPDEEPETEAKAHRLHGVVSEVPVVIRDKSGQVKTVSLMAKVQFKGEVKVIMQGDLASAYWSLTPDMNISFMARPVADKEYLAESLEVTAAV